MPSVEINYWAILVAAIVFMIIGAIYYAPPVFGNTWMKLIGKNQEELRAGAGVGYFGMFITALIELYVLSHFVNYAQATTVSEGLVSGFWIWLGFVATVTFGEFLFAKKPLGLWVVNNGYNLLSLLVGGAILAAWA